MVRPPYFGGDTYGSPRATFPRKRMTSDIDIYRSANELIKQFGDAADIEAAMRVDELMNAGDMEGEAVWLRIVKTIEEFAGKRAAGG